MSIEFKFLSEAERQTCHEMCLGMFLDGACYEFAIALQRGLGWPLVGLMNGKVIRHAAVRSSRGIIFDVRGEVSEEEFGRPFGLYPPYVIKEITKEDLLRVRSISDRLVEHATMFIEKIWPDLDGWQPSDFRRRVEAFMKGLEELSREHGIFIRSSLPSARPIVCDSPGDERGYVLFPTTTSEDFFFDRDLG